jgi:hypothetical protein
MRPYRILVTGSRDWDDVRTVDTELTALGRRVPSDRPIVVVDGLAAGLDCIAHGYALGRMWGTERHPADWDTHGKGAGSIRNQAMVDLGADVCLAFPTASSVGTWDCVRRANKAGIRVIIVPAKPHPST